MDSKERYNIRKILGKYMLLDDEERVYFKMFYEGKLKVLKQLKKTLNNTVIINNPEAEELLEILKTKVNRLYNETKTTLTDDVLNFTELEESISNHETN